jgi:hypothetical protein
VKRGDIIYDPDIEFDDGGRADKLFVILSDIHSSGYVYTVLATSKGKSKDRDCQPSHMSFFVPSGKEFPKDTWLDLKRRPLCLPAKTLKERLDNSICRVVGTLKEDKVNAVRNCIDRHCSAWLSRQYCDILGIKYKG